MRNKKFVVVATAAVMTMSSMLAPIGVMAAETSGTAATEDSAAEAASEEISDDAEENAEEASAPAEGNAISVEASDALNPSQYAGLDRVWVPDYSVYPVKVYWVENGVIQGTVNDPKGVKWKGDSASAPVRGREIYDPLSKSWYWLDSDDNGAKAVSKDVLLPYVDQNEDTMSNAQKRTYANSCDSGMSDFIYQSMINKDGKWVRYDSNGVMIKGWQTTSAGTYYFDHTTGAMAKGKISLRVWNSSSSSYVTNTYFFNETTGIRQTGWVSYNGNTYYFDPSTGVMYTGIHTINGTTYTFTDEGVRFIDQKTNEGTDVYQGVFDNQYFGIEYRGYNWVTSGTNRGFYINLKIKNSSYHSAYLEMNHFSANGITANIAFSYDIAARHWTDPNNNEIVSIYVPMGTISNRGLNANGMHYVDFNLNIYLNGSSNATNTGNIHISFG